MREIKFRAWHTVKGKMYSWEYIKNTYTIHALSDENVVQLKFMQYTGLKDKNGVGIYEGDILRLNNSKGQTANRQEVYWDEESAAFDWRTANDNSWPDGFTGFYDEYEVIGNVYENPELLKEEE